MAPSPERAAGSDALLELIQALRERGAEPGRQPLNSRASASVAAGEEAASTPTATKRGAELEAAAGELAVEGEDAGGLSGAADAGDRPLDRGDDLRVAGSRRMAEAGREVVGADEDAVDAVHRGDRLDIADRLGGLDLHEKAELLSARAV